MIQDTLAVQSSNENEETIPSSQPIFGIIYPPPEVIIKIDILDKTASFVARYGPEFESRIRHNELGNAKFNFLTFGDPYHAYYQHKVKEFKEGKGQEPNFFTFYSSIMKENVPVNIVTGQTKL